MYRSPLFILQMQKGHFVQRVGGRGTEGAGRLGMFIGCMILFCGGCSAGVPLAVDEQGILTTDGGLKISSDERFGSIFDGTVDSAVRDLVAADHAPIKADAAAEEGQKCGAAPISLNRFPRSMRTTIHGRIFSGWGGGPAATPAAKAPIIFVHGNGGDANDWLPLYKDLCKRGYRAQELWAITFQDNACIGPCSSGSNTEHAEELKQLVKLVKDHSSSTQVVLVAQSMGVMPVRYYLKFLGGIDRREVALAYLVSGPNHGLPACDQVGAAAINVACAEIYSMNWVNGWLYQLNTPDETPCGQGDPCFSSAKLVYRTVSYAMDPYYPGVYALSPQLDGADNLVLAGSAHGEVPLADFLSYLPQASAAD